MATMNLGTTTGQTLVWPSLSHLPIYVFVISCLAYLLGRPLLGFIGTFILPGDGQKVPGSGLDQAEKGSVMKPEDMSDAELFDLEKRAFFSKTWLYVCHRSRFDKPGDYLAFDVAGISFFVVLSKRDNKLRAFHNVCRHRAYTVVRKPCGTSARFSCKYHGWQYDDEGRLVKAPKFDESPGFVPEDNGLFEVKLITTREGLVFVNFDASTMDLPFNNVKSHVDLWGTDNDCVWVDGMNVTCATDWKDLANEFARQQDQSTQTPFGWLAKLGHRRSKTMASRLLGPLSLTKELSPNLWCTMTLLPRSPSETTVRCDIYASLKQAGRPPLATVERCKWMLEKELINLSKPVGDQSKAVMRSNFAYKCGGRTIDLFAILTQHQRNEKLAKKKLQPAIRVTSTADIDMEAEALCDALDGATETPSLEKCSRMSSFPQTLEW